MSRALGPTERTRLRRKPVRGSHDAAVVHAILDEALICHVGIAGRPGDAGGAPIVIPTTHVRLDDRLYVHGSAASHLLGALAAGVEACVTVTLLDGLVLARTAMHHSVNYRSVVLFGRGVPIDDDDEKRRALAALLDKMVAGRSRACRAPDERELIATKVIGFAITEASAKIRTGPPLAEDGADALLPYWSGVVPVRTAWGTPEPSPDCTVVVPDELRLAAAPAVR